MSQLLGFIYSRRAGQIIYKDPLMGDAPVELAEVPAGEFVLFPEADKAAIPARVLHRLLALRGAHVPAGEDVNKLQDAGLLSPHYTELLRADQLLRQHRIDLSLL